MAESDYEKRDFVLTLDGKYYNTLDISGFSQMLKDPSYCYKFYWLEAIVRLVSEGVNDTTFNELIDEMIANAWYSVREYHIHLSGYQMGEVRDGLERAVLKLAELSGLPANASKIQIKNAIRKHDIELKLFKEQLTNNVPYRSLAGFFNNCDEPANWGSVVRLISYIERLNQTTLLPYTLGPSPKLKKEVHFSSAWAEMLRDNTTAILGWIQYEKVRWLQTNNPEVPGLVYKLAPSEEAVRKLGHVRKLWENVLTLQPVRDVFTGAEINGTKYDVDHFVPWSFVMSDELWNLMPMDSSLNSQKSNRLPKWDPFFSRFEENQYILYDETQKKPETRVLFEKCYRDNLHSLWAGQELYRPGNSREEFRNILEKNMLPVYESARRQGYEVWNYVKIG